MSDGPILEIAMQTRPGADERCCVPRCPNYGSGFHALPIFNGDIVSNDWPGEWGALPCCERCYELHLAGQLPTADHLYRHLFERWGMFQDGGGI